jgi:hypothetical protein
LLARRLVERGVRFVQVYSGGAHIQVDHVSKTQMMVNVQIASEIHLFDVS